MTRFQKSAHAKAAVASSEKPWHQVSQKWRRVSSQLKGMDRRKAGVGVALLCGLVVASVGVHFFRSHTYAHWQSIVTPLATDAAVVQQQVGTALRKVTQVGTSPLGASVHAEGALIEINTLNAIMRGLIVSSTEPAILQSTFAKHPDAQKVLAHDRDLLRRAKLQLQLAHAELDRANTVLSYGKKWHDLDPYALQPAGLSEQWLNDAIGMRSALNSGDLEKIEQSDLRLESLLRGGEIARSAENIVAQLSTVDHAVAMPYLTIIKEAVIQGDLARAQPALDTLTMMHKQIPLSYSLYLLSVPGEKTFVIKQDAHDRTVTHHYLIVQATDEHGAQVSVDIHDTELDKNVTASRFGVEVSADTFARTQSDERDALLMVGKKTAGTFGTEFALPILAGRISRW